MKIDNKELNYMLKIIKNHDLLCAVCKFQFDCYEPRNIPSDSSKGFMYPICQSWGCYFEYRLYDKNSIIDLYQEIINNEI